MHGIRVLIVDDFEEWRQFVSSAIAEITDRENIREASDGEEAIEKVKGWKSNLAVLDIGLPKMNGIEVARQLRELYPECKVIFFTENRSSDVIEECFRAGANGYVLKSSGVNDLLSAVNAVLKHNDS